MSEFREKMLKEIKILFEKSLFCIDEKIVSIESIEFFTNGIEKLLREINEAQNNNLEEVANIFLMLSRNNIEQGVLEYKVYCYGKNMYIDKLDFQSSFNISYVFDNFLEAKNEIPKTVRKYVNFDIEEGLQESSKYIILYNFIVVKVLREVFKNEKILKLVGEIKKSDNFHIVVGEIYEKPYLIHELKKE